MFHITIVLTDNACIRAETCVRTSLSTTVNTRLKMYQNNHLLHAPNRVERDMKQLGRLEGTQEALLSVCLERLSLVLFKIPAAHLLPTHRLINSAFQTSCKVNCPKLMTKFNSVFAKCNTLLLTFEQTFTDGAV